MTGPLRPRRAWVERSRLGLSRMWQDGLDILEYQDAGVVRERVAAGGLGLAALRRALGFVLVAALLNSLFALAAGVLSGTAVEATLSSILDFVLGFLVNTVVIFAVGRLLGGRAAFGPFTYATALYSVPLQVVQALLMVAVSLIPVIGYFLLLLVLLLAAGARVVFSNLVTQAMMQFRHPWQRALMLLVLVGLALLGGALNFLG